MRRGKKCHPWTTESKEEYLEIVKKTWPKNNADMYKYKQKKSDLSKNHWSNFDSYPFLQEQEETNGQRFISVKDYTETLNILKIFKDVIAFKFKGLRWNGYCEDRELFSMRRKMCGCLDVGKFKNCVRIYKTKMRTIFKLLNLANFK